MLYLPKHVFWLITTYAWNKRLTLLDLQLDLTKVDDIQECVPRVFLNPVCYDSELNTWVPSPFRAAYPYFPTVDLDLYTIWSTCLEYIPGVIALEFYRREKTYRSVFRRHLRQLKTSGFAMYNFLLARYFERILKNDFPNHDDFTPVWESLQLARPTLKSFEP